MTDDELEASFARLERSLKQLDNEIVLLILAMRAVSVMCNCVEHARLRLDELEQFRSARKP